MAQSEYITCVHLMYPWWFQCRYFNAVFTFINNTWKLFAFVSSNNLFLFVSFCRLLNQKTLGGPKRSQILSKMENPTIISFLITATTEQIGWWTSDLWRHLVLHLKLLPNHLRLKSAMSFHTSYCIELFSISFHPFSEMWRKYTL